MSLLDFKANLFFQKIPKIDRDKDIIPIAGTKGGIPYMSMLGSQNALNRAPEESLTIPATTQNETQTMDLVRPPTRTLEFRRTNPAEIIRCIEETTRQMYNASGKNRNKLRMQLQECEAEFRDLKHTELRLPKIIIPSTSHPIKPTKTMELVYPKGLTEKELRLPNTEKELRLPNTEMTFDRKKIENIRTDFHAGRLEEIRENTTAPTIKPPWNIPEENQAMNAWHAYVKKRYGTDAGRLEWDYIMVDQTLYDIAKATIREANKQIDDFLYKQDEFGTTDAEQEAIENFGTAFYKHIFAFVFDKVKAGIMEGIVSELLPKEKVAREGAKKLANEFLNGIKTAIQYFANLSYKDTVRDINNFKSNVMSFNNAWPPAYKRYLRTQVNELPGNSQKLPPNSKVPKEFQEESPFGV